MSVIAQLMGGSGVGNHGCYYCNNYNKAIAKWTAIPANGQR